MILFFMMGFITCLNDNLTPFFKNAFALDYAAAARIQFFFFSAYLLLSIPAGRIIQYTSYKTCMIIGFAVASVGCLLFLPAAQSHSYPLFLFAIFILACGITLLQVAANPYISILGKPETASSRLTLTQAFNSLATFIAPLFGTEIILSKMIKPETGVPLTTAQLEMNLQAVQTPYIGLAIALMSIAGLVAVLKLPIIKPQDSPSSSQAPKSLFAYKHLIFGVVAIFCYVGAEVTIGNFLINYIGEPYIMDLSEYEAGNYLAYYWGGAMIGRFAGALALKELSPSKILAFNAIAAVVLILASIALSGKMGMWTMLAVGLCNSIMFPTIFTLAIKDLGSLTNRGTELLSMAIFGGAVLPLLQGLLADQVGLQYAFLLPAFCYVYIAWYGLQGSKTV
jgi:MFS transporter, FHS family, L-fucose permease